MYLKALRHTWKLHDYIMLNGGESVIVRQFDNCYIWYPVTWEISFETYDNVEHITEDEFKDVYEKALSVSEFKNKIQK